MFRGSFLGPKKLEKRLSQVTDAYSSDEDDDEHDIAAALSEAQLQKDSKPPSFRDLLASPCDDDDDDGMNDFEPSASHHDDVFSIHEPVTAVADEELMVDDLFHAEVKGHSFEKGDFQVSEGELFGSLGDIGHGSFAANPRASPRRVMATQPFMVSPCKSAKVDPADIKFEEEDGHDSFDFSVVKFSPQQQKKGKVGLGKHFAAMAQSELINEDEEEDEEEEVSIAEFSGQWQTMQQASSQNLLQSPKTPSQTRGSALRRSSYETPRRRGSITRVVTPRSRSFEESPQKLSSRSMPATPVVPLSESPTKRAQTTGTRKKRSIKLKASALGLEDGATAAEIKAALERVSPNQLKAALEKQIESDDDDDGLHRGRRRPSGGNKSVNSHKERSRSKASVRSTSRDDNGDDGGASNPLRRSSRRSRSSHTKESKDKSRSHSSKSTKSSASRRSSDKSDRRSSSKTQEKQPQQEQQQQMLHDADGFPSPSSPTWSMSSNTTTSYTTSSDSSFPVASSCGRRSSLKDVHHRAHKQVVTADPFYGAFDD